MSASGSAADARFFFFFFFFFSEPSSDLARFFDGFASVGGGGGGDGPSDGEASDDDATVEAPACLDRDAFRHVLSFWQPAPLWSPPQPPDDDGIESPTP